MRSPFVSSTQLLSRRHLTDFELECPSVAHSSCNQILLLAVIAFEFSFYVGTRQLVNIFEFLVACGWYFSPNLLDVRDA